MVIRMRHTREHTKNRRSHHALSEGSITVDQKSGVPHMRHRASLVTGAYRGRQVIDVVKKVEKKQSKKAGQKEGAR